MTEPPKPGTSVGRFRRLKHRFLHVAAGISLILSVALLAIHCTGGFPSGPAFKPLVGRWEYLLDGDRTPDRHGMVIQLVVLHGSHSPIVGPVIPMGSSPQWDAWLKKYPTKRWRGHGFGLEYGPSIGTDSARRAITNGTRLHLIAPYWALELLFLLPPLFVWMPRFWRKQPPEPGAVPCLTCGYDLRASPDRCPECGAAVQFAPSILPPDSKLRPIAPAAPSR